MTVKQIIEQVRLSLDEEKGYEDYESGYMDNIIKGKINDAMRWTSMYCDASLLTAGGVSSGSSIISEKVSAANVNEVDLGSDCMRVVRVRGSEWSRAILTPAKEDSEEMMMQSDETAKADKMHPVAIIVEGATTKILGYPADTITVDYIKAPVGVNGSTLSESTVVNVPYLAEPAFVYYLAYLVMIAYGDGSKANMMLATAKMNAGLSDRKD